MDLPVLKALLNDLVAGLKNRGTHDDLPEIGAKLGLSIPSDGSKRDRMRAGIQSAADADLPTIAQRFLIHFPPAAPTRIALQELLWADDPGPRLPKRFRRELARKLTEDDLYLDGPRFDTLLDTLFDLDDNPFAFLTGQDESLRAQIAQHVHRNRGDWKPDELFERLGAYESSDRRFALLLEGLASASVRPDVADQRRFVGIVNDALVPCRVELREVGEDGGYPTFKLVSLAAGPAGRPKNLIFASPEKPDLRLRDAISNDIEIVSNVDRVLVYDRHIGEDGLLWSHLQDWWMDMAGSTDAEAAKKTLYHRLMQSLPRNSPPQLLLFETFFRSFGSAVPRLPVLLPEVWLHWDPKTVAERGADALLRFRMDFLLLLPHHIRIVIEVDGKHHYADAEGRASPAQYAATMAADRELQLSGYEVFHFGAAELNGDDGKARAKEFFYALFRRHGVWPRKS